MKSKIILFSSLIALLVLGFGFNDAYANWQALSQDGVCTGPFLLSGVWDGKTKTCEITTQERAIPMERITIKKGDVLVVDKGYTLKIPTGKELQINGKLEISGTVINEGTIQNAGTIENSGNIKNWGTFANHCDATITGNISGHNIIETECGSDDDINTAIKNGNWNDVDTWQGGIPTKSDNISIPQGITVKIPSDYGIYVGPKHTLSITGHLDNQNLIVNNGIIEIGNKDHIGINIHSGKLLVNDRINDEDAIPTIIISNAGGTGIKNHWGKILGNGIFIISNSGGVGIDNEGDATEWYEDATNDVISALEFICEPFSGFDPDLAGNSEYREEACDIDELGVTGGFFTAFNVTISNSDGYGINNHNAAYFDVGGTYYSSKSYVEGLHKFSYPYPNGIGHMVISNSGGIGLKNHYSDAALGNTMVSNTGGTGIKNEGNIRTYGSPSSMVIDNGATFWGTQPKPSATYLDNDNTNSKHKFKSELSGIMASDPATSTMGKQGYSVGNKAAGTLVSPTNSDKICGLSLCSEKMTMDEIIQQYLQSRN